MKYPDSWKRTLEISTLDYDGEKERALVRGSLIFPEYNPDKEMFCGALCVGAETIDKSEIRFFEFEYFTEYNTGLADKFARMYKKYGLNKYYYRMDSGGISRAERFVEELHRRRSKMLDSVYPSLVPLTFSTDYASMHQLIGSIDRISYPDSPEITKDILEWTSSEKKDFQSSPAFIRAMATLCNGFDADTTYYSEKEKNYLASLPGGGCF